ncbi:MAG: PspA/IM30 family protein [Myxococcales bacterium]|nr:PspA/IM30 family protein [Myxococcales bacterium]MDH3844288.1 PspA/IM30 family protein [Myxococcales bacterium]
MNRVKRWTMSVTSWVDGVLAQVENHEAAVNSAIGRVRQSTARARVQLRRVERDEQALRESLAKEEEAAIAWRRRAKSAHDDEKAFECLRRHKAAERRVVTLRQRLAEQERAHKELREGIKLLHGRLSELTERKNVMRTRQSHAEAAHGMTSAAGPIGDLDEVFDRWESRVGEIEIAADYGDPIDAFEADIDHEEESRALRIELDELRAEQD